MKQFLSKTGDFSDLSELKEPIPLRPIGWTTVKMILGLLNAVKYAMSLFLMLVAMTFNPSLFLALFVGYWAGDMLFCDFELNLG